MFRVFPEALDPCFTLSPSSPCNVYHWEGNHIENIHGDDVIITIYRLVPNYIVGMLTSHC